MLRWYNSFLAILFFCGILGFGAYLRQSQTDSNLELVQSSVEKRLEQIIHFAQNDANQIAQSIELNKAWPKTKTTFLFWVKDSLAEWNAPVYFTPPVISPIDSIFWLQSQSIKALVLTKRISDSTWLTGLVPLQYTHKALGKISSAKINSEIFNENDLVVYPPKENGRMNISYKGKPMFSLDIPNRAFIQFPSATSWFCLLVGILGLFIVIPRIKTRFTILVWMATIVLIRLYMVYFKFPGTTANNPVLSPAVFASSSLNDSPLNFLLNALTLWLLIFVAFKEFKNFQWSRNLTQIGGVGYQIFLHFFSFGSVLLPILFMETVFRHSNITSDVTQSVFFSTERVVLLFAILISGMISFYILKKLLKPLHFALKKSLQSFLLSLFLFLSLLFFYQKLSGRDHLLGIYVLLMFYSLLYIRSSGLVKKISWLKNKWIADYVLLLIISVVFASTTSKLDQEQSRKQLVKIEKSLFNERDEFTEYLLQQAINQISSDVFIRIVNDAPLLEKQKIQDRIERKFPPGYFNETGPQVFHFNTIGVPMPGTSGTIDALIQEMDTVWTSRSGMILYDSNKIQTSFTRRYVALIPVGERIKSTIALEVGGPVYPDADRSLIQQMISGQFQNTLDWKDQFSMAIVGSERPLFQFGEFDYQNQDWTEFISLIQNQLDGQVYGNYLHLYMKDMYGRGYILSAPAFDQLRWITNFFLCLFLGLILIAFIWIFGLISKVFQGQSISYADRIRVYLFSAFSIPIFILALFITQTVGTETQEREIKSMRLKANRVADEISINLNFQDDDDNIRSELAKISQTLGCELLIYRKDGSRMVSGNSKILESGLMPFWMDPQALRELTGGKNYFVNIQRAGELDYLSVFVPINSPDSNRPNAFLSIPDFQFFSLQEKQIIQTMTKILSVVAPVFLVFLLLSYIMVNRLTKPLFAVSKALQKTTFTTLPSAGEDEMGLMVKEYNQMLTNLEISRKQVLQQQRDVAWREMARQVAHEIRNPLTPIRLTIQRILMNLKTGKLEAEETDRSLHSVLTQTEVLSDIADSFSALAGMPKLSPERIDLIKVIREDISLYIENDQKNISIISPSSQPIEVWIDRKLFSRIISNLILNARQSSDRDVDIKIMVSLSSTFALVEVRDNGGGIEPSIQEKIFSPYFTTKIGGTGLGLWLTKQGLEQSGGKIWFETVPGSGTSFFIEIPRVGG